jgi:hypothetical protein
MAGADEADALLRAHGLSERIDEFDKTLQIEGRLALLAQLKLAGLTLGVRQRLANSLARRHRELHPPPPVAPEVEAMRKGALRPLVVSAVGGMCNRLRVVLSWRLVALDQGRPLVVQWVPSSACRGAFADAWAPLPPSPPVFFTENAQELLQHSGLQLEESCRPHPQIGEDDTERSASCYEPLRPQPTLLAEAAALAASLGTFVAVHIRRTDHKYGLKESDEDFQAFLERHAAHRVFLATDNCETQAYFQAQYGTRLCVQRPIAAVPEQVISSDEMTRGLSQTRRWTGEGVLARDYRHTPLRDGIVDLLVCTHAVAFKGSRFSSFSDTILQLRRQRETASEDDEHTIVLPRWGDSYDNSWEAELMEDGA